MRSMFPRYDSSRPLARQSYYPHLESIPGLASAMAMAGSSSKDRYSNNPYRQQMTRRCLDDGRSSSESQVPKITEIRESPLRAVDNLEQPIKFSSPEDLNELWNIANGQVTSEETADAYALELSW